MATLDGVPLEKGLELEIYDQSQEKWIPGRITRIYDSYSDGERMYDVECVDIGGRKTIREKDVHSLMRHPPKSQTIDYDEEKLQNLSKETAFCLSLPEQTVFESFQSLSKHYLNIDALRMFPTKIIAAHFPSTFS